MGPAVARWVREAECLQANPCPSLGLSGAGGQGLWDLPGQRFSKGLSEMGSEEDGERGRSQELPWASPPGACLSARQA